jgi:hypothetical protein
MLWWWMDVGVGVDDDAAGDQVHQGGTPVGMAELAHGTCLLGLWLDNKKELNVWGRGRLLKTLNKVNVWGRDA